MERGDPHLVFPVGTALQTHPEKLVLRVPFALEPLAQLHHLLLRGLRRLPEPARGAPRREHTLLRHSYALGCLLLGGLLRLVLAPLPRHLLEQHLSMRRLGRARYLQRGAQQPLQPVLQLLALAERDAIDAYNLIEVAYPSLPSRAGLVHHGDDIGRGERAAEAALRWPRQRDGELLLLHPLRSRGRGSREGGRGVISIGSLRRINIGAR